MEMLPFRSLRLLTLAADGRLFEATPAMMEVRHSILRRVALLALSYFGLLLSSILASSMDRTTCDITKTERWYHCVFLWVVH